MNNLVKSALWAGIPYREIYALTPEDIATAVEVINEKQKDFFRGLAWIVYNGAALTGVAVNDPRKFPRLEDAFPSLFEKKEQQDWWVMKERVENFARVKNNTSTKIY